MAAMKLYMTPGSCSTGVHILLEELDEVFEAHVVNLPAGDHFKPDYVAINPKSTIPTLVRRDGSALTEVQSIIYWLALSHPKAGLWPADADRASFLVEVMAHVVGTIHGQGFARLFAANSFTRSPDDHEAMRQLGRDIVAKGFAVLDRQMEARGDSGAGYLAGAFSAADPVLFYVEFWADKTGIALPPRLAAHYRLMLTRPTVQQVLREEGYNPAALARFEAAAVS